MSQIFDLGSNVIRLTRGFVVYWFTGETPDWAYRTLLNMFCKTRGVSNDVIHFFIRLFTPKYNFPSSMGILGDISGSKSKEIKNALRTKGYYVFDQKLPADKCQQLLDFGLRTPASAFTPHATSRYQLAVYNRANPISEVYRFEEQSLVENPIIEGLMLDYSMLNVAQEYFGCAPILDQVGLWWTASYQQKASEEAAQMYHFDMDRVKWLKFFVYLTDVTESNGPHIFIEGTHRARKQPKELLNRGYVRIPDSDVEPHYPKDAIRELTGKQGTIIAVDTRGWHKGKPLMTGDRLVLQFEFTTSLFGANPAKTRVKRSTNNRLWERAVNYPRVYKKFTGTLL